MPTPPEQPEPDLPAATEARTPTPNGRAQARRLTAEIWIVLGLSLGQSGIYSIWNIIQRLTVAQKPLSEQTASLHTSRAETGWVDFVYQILSIGFAFVPVALVLFLLSASGRSTFRRLGFDFTNPKRDLLRGTALAAAIGVPGLAFYLIGRALGFTVNVQASGLSPVWWAAPVLILSAFQNAIVEEVIVVGYLFTRLRELRWNTLAIMVASATLRGSYHLYQGFGGFIGNFVMGLVFGWFYTRTKRVMPLVVAHALIDIVAFLGYALLPEAFTSWLGLT